jgi:hypothetical protein
MHHSAVRVNTPYLRRSVRPWDALSAAERGATPVTWDLSSRLHQVPGSTI